MRAFSGPDVIPSGRCDSSVTATRQHDGYRHWSETRIVVSAVGHHDAMDDDEIWDGHRMVDQRTRQIAYRVRGRRVCDAKTNALVYRIRDNCRVVDARSNRLVFRIRDDGRVVDANTNELRYRLKD